MATNNIGAAARSEIVVRYRECRRNHAAPIMRYAVDGCGDFTPAGEDGTPEALLCGACSCHRSFHRKEVQELQPPPLHRHPITTFLPPPPPIPQPHVATYNDPVPQDEVRPGEWLDGGEIEEEVGASGRNKKGRTRLTPEQKERMRVFADKLSWRVQKYDREEEIGMFCVEIGITPQIFKNWVNNNRHKMENGQPSSTPKC
ncbi:zinc-finger homeodomain protein 10-like [Cornus florida]|uniref:zinc-finger homeodomain protein 10-like n=1 Tax=Cornus florida TaxID=4283 RepID=UPI00289ABF06|nr:zinc-finger homeodomain protein 10-like [Cornus florida]